MFRSFLPGSATPFFIAGLTLWTVCQTAACSTVYDQLDLIVDVRHELVNNYVEQPDEMLLVQSAVRGMIESLDDPYTVFLSEEDLTPFQQQVRGRFSGIGAEVEMHNDRLRIITPLEDSPAWEAGVLAGDVVLEIEGESTQGMSLREAIRRLTGEAGTTVMIKVRHRTGEEQQLRIIRDVINVPTVRGVRRSTEGQRNNMLDGRNKIGYLRISQFTDTTADDVAEAISRLKQQGMKALILDVRFNPGGLLQSATAVSDLFLPPGDRIVSVKGRRTPEKVYDAKTQPMLPMDLPIVVIANESSASASEILAGALAENDRALFVGSRTFGKGSVQTVRQLLDGHAALKLTSAHYYLPTGRNIHKTGEDDLEWGVDPSPGSYVPMSVDEIRAMTEARRDSELQKMLSDQAKGLQITPAWIETTFKDKQLAKALEAALGKLATGQWPQVGLTINESLIKQRKRQQLMEQKRRIEEALAELNSQLAAIDGQGVIEPEKVEAKLQEAVDAGRDVMPEAGTIDEQGSDLPLR